MGANRNNMPACSVYLRNPRGKNKSIDGTIYIRFFVRGKYVEQSTNIHIPVDHWNKQSQQVNSKNKDWRRLNAEIESIKVKYNDKLKEVKGVITPAIVKAIIAGDYIPREELSQKTDFIQYCLDFNQQRYDLDKISYSTYDHARYNILAFKQYIKKTTGEEELPISNLSIDLINKYVNWRITEKGNTKESVNKTLTPLFLAIKYASDNEIIPLRTATTICNYLETKNRKYQSNVESKRIRYLTPEQMKQFLEIYKSVKYDRTRDIMDMFLFAIHACGLRVSDIITLEWKHIDWDRKVISKNFVKTKAHTIDIPLTDPAIEILNRWKGRNKVFVFDILPEQYNVNNAKDLNSIRQSKNRTFQQSLKAVGQKMNLPFNLTFHCARHTFAVLAIKKGLDIYLVSKLLGHASITVTEKVYAEILQKDIDVIVKENLTLNF